MARVEIRGCVKIQKKYERCDATLGRVLIPASSQIIKSAPHSGSPCFEISGGVQLTAANHG